MKNEVKAPSPKYNSVSRNNKRKASLELFIKQRE